MPAYRLEPRVDPFFALFLRDVMAMHFEVEINPTIIPEMRLRRGTLWGESTDSPNKSVKVDYAVFTKDRSKVYLVELKTDEDSFDIDQEGYLKRAQEPDVGFPRLVDGILEITRVTDMKFIPKYIKRGITYKVNPEIVTMNLAVRSLYLVSQHIPLSEEEAQAIVAHDGVYPVNGGVTNLEYFNKECRLQMIVHFADKWTAAVEEEGRR